MSAQLRARLTIGDLYNRDDIARMMGRDPNAFKNRGVNRVSGADCFAIFVTIDKRSDATPYADELNEDGNLLFWEGQTNMKSAESYFDQGLDCFAFVRSRSRDPFKYYGRCVPVRTCILPPGQSSRFVLGLWEYAAYKERRLGEQISSPTPDYLETERNAIQAVRTKQKAYRDAVVDFWHGRCAVSGVDEPGWLIASHIKPWRESSDRERVDPRNSLLLSPDYDKLFDKGVISFNPDNGKILLPEHMTRSVEANLERLGIDDTRTLSSVPDGTDAYLEYHRRRIFGYRAKDEDDVDNLVSQALGLNWKIV